MFADRRRHARLKFIAKTLVTAAQTDTDTLSSPVEPADVQLLAHRHYGLRIEAAEAVDHLNTALQNAGYPPITPTTSN